MRFAGSECVAVLALRDLKLGFSPRQYIGDAAQRAALPGMVLRKLMPDRWHIRIVELVHGQVLFPGRSPNPRGNVIPASPGRHATRTYLSHHRDDAFWIEWLPMLVEMTSLGEGGCDLA